MNETNFTKFIRSKLPGFWYKTVGGIYQQVGLPDLIGCVGGYFIGLELKVEPNKITPKQILCLKDIVELGAGLGICMTLERSGDVCVTSWLEKEQKMVSLELHKPLTASTLGSKELMGVFGSLLSEMKEGYRSRSWEKTISLCVNKRTMITKQQ